VSILNCIEAVQSSQISVINDREAQSFLAKLYGKSKYVRCGGNLKNTGNSWSRMKPKNLALREQWISYNNNSHWNALTIDCDHTDWPQYLRCLIADGMPEPSIIVSGYSGTAHITWLYAIGKNKTDADMRRMHEGIYEALRAALCGDILFKQYLTKNPVHLAYDVVRFTGNTYDFSDFLTPLIESYGENSYVLGPKWESQFQGKNPNIKPFPATLEDIAGPKGSRVFEIGHRRVHRRRSADYGVIHSIYQDVATELGSPIAAKALAGMAKRSTRWMLAHPNMIGTPARDMRIIDEGIMRRDAAKRNQLKEWNSLELSTKRALAAERTNTIRQDKAAGTLVSAAVSLWNGHKNITQISLANEAGMSLRYVKTCWNTYLGKIPKGAPRSNPFSIANGAASLASLSGKNTTLKQLSILSKQRAASFRQEQESISLYYEQAKRMKMRNAEVEQVVPRGANASAELKASHTAALASQADCKRRADARIVRYEQKFQAQQRRERFQAWAIADDMEAYRLFLKQESTFWDMLQDSVADDKDSKDKVRMRRGVAFKRYTTEWKSCCLIEAHRRQIAYWDCQRKRNDIPINSIPNVPIKLKLPSFLTQKVA
jgi:hypothetical protein